MSDLTDKVAKKRELQFGCAKLEKLLLASDPLQRTYNELRLPLYVREPGCWLSAPFGEGKSVAMDYCASALAAEVPGLPIFKVNEHVLPGNELRSFLRSALIASKYDKPDATRTDTLRNRLAHHWAELSFSSPLGCVVLLLDEGNSMREADEFLLKDLGNEIHMYRGALQTFVFGESPKLDLLVSQRRNVSQNGAVDRLWCGHKINLHLYESESDWKSLFQQMDQEVFRELSNLSIRSFFFGHMDISGYSMEQEAPRFWRALESTAKHKGGTVNLRRIFVGIRQAILKTALDTLDLDVQRFTGVSEAGWQDALQYGCVCEDSYAK